MGALLERGCNIQSTHIEFGQVNVPSNAMKPGKAREKWLKALFSAMQASTWCPNGEARQLLAQLRLTHASMSIGDAIQIGPGELYVIGLTSFFPIEQASLLLPPQFGGLDEDTTILSPDSRHNDGSESSEGDENEQSG